MSACVKSWIVIVAVFLLNAYPTLCTLQMVVGREGQGLTFGPSIAKTLSVGGMAKWVLIEQGSCAPKPAEVCVSQGKCIYDLVYGDDEHSCRGRVPAPRTLAILVKEANGVMKQITYPESTENLMRDLGYAITPAGDIRIDGATRDHSGLYGVREIGVGQSFLFYNVTIRGEDDTDFDYSNGYADLPNRIDPESNHDQVSVAIPPLHLFNPLKTLILRPRMTVIPASWRTEYNLTYSWYEFIYDPSCTDVRLYEACIYHPLSGGCANPEGPYGCTIGSPTRSELVGRAQLTNCRGQDLRTCAFSQLLSGRGSAGLGPVFPELQIDGSSARPAVYLIVIDIEGLVVGWAYTGLSLPNSAMPIVVDMHIPDASSWEGIFRGKLPRGKNLSTGSIASLEIVVTAIAILLICCAVGICIFMRRRKVRRMREGRPWTQLVDAQSKTYVRLPSNEFFLSSDDEDEELLYESGSAPRKTNNHRRRHENALNRLDKTVKIAISSVADRFLTDKAHVSRSK
ncbi:Envelope glycoprotein E [Cacatuid alphaherpesvirus 2]|uniref:Envelope glycoprotein E n=1 Tax=Cacatuid alphaherpesvirus 2 TaxID=2604840 RepID=A0A5B9R025_9ALPH|nr:Envelope glycoprotein E [Cacatuid alphaherpesvirus 2]QEG54062.1 Envelope glycoprotein E [Cacatuid alphaherpesvirus 2]